MEVLDKAKLPRHLAVIMDGNGRWAQNRGLRRVEGHKAGAEAVRTLTRACRNMSIKFLTLYAFSEENWQRPRTEIEAIWRLLNHYMKNELKEMLQNDIRFNTLGDLERIPRSTRGLIKETKDKTSQNTGMVLSLALSYGGRQDILQAARSMAEDCLSGRLKPGDMDEAAFSLRLQSQGLPDPDLLIRTGGELRISNFLLWQMAYTEIFFTSCYWPDFREKELEQALLDYQSRERRFGKTGEQIRGKRAPRP
ncbi:MAG: isoprenyl transferase [Thermodesulfobacteriota bacterium]|nr:isoprenyl transferase [Thermodesulfobacteriota bacterium]